MRAFTVILLWCSLLSSSTSNDFCSRETGRCDDAGESNVVKDDLSAAKQDGDIDSIEEDANSALIDPTLNSLEQDDPRLVKALKERFLIPPVKDKPYNFSANAKLDMNGQYGQPSVLDQMLGGDRKRGFFIEAGAYDGERLSNTLLFEIKHQWSGLLVEPNPEAFQKLKHKNRRAWALGNCLSTKTHPEIVEFDAVGLFGGILNPLEGYKRPGDGVEKAYRDHKIEPDFERKIIKVQCFPLYSVLLALGNPTVDIFSLDIEGAELQVLRTIPFDKVDIKILMIEMNHVGEVFEGSGRQVRKLLQKAGYDFYRGVEIDEIFVKNGFDYYK